MRIVQLITSYELWGAERVLLDLSRAVRSRGVDVRVAALREGTAQLAEALHVEGIPIFHGARHRHAPDTWWRLRRWVHAQRPDVVHAHLWLAHVMGTLIRPDGAALVWSHHNLGTHLTGFRGWVNRSLWSRPDAHAFVSDVARGRYRRTLGLPDDRARVIHNGIPLGAFEQVVPRRGPVIGSMARFIPRKGLDVLLDASARLARERSALRVRLVGDGPEREAIRERARSLGIADRVDILPWTDDVASFLGSLNLFVMPSRDEGFGMALVEALASGVPVVASELPALSEVGGDAVRWVPPGDPGALAEAIRTLPDHAWTGVAIRTRRERAGRFTLERMVDGYMALYEELAARG